jgi:hypothetical protein
VKYIDPVVGLDTGSKLIHLTLSGDIFVSDVISNPPIRIGGRTNSASPQSVEI